MLGLLLCFFCISCGEKETEFQEVTTPRFAQPLMAADSVVTIISDSGITRYRISTTQWDIYDHVSEPYWGFPKGIKLERFDTLMHVDARMWADTATYWEKKALWEFKGHVSARNLKGEVFETTQLFFNQDLERFYSDRMIKIHQSDKILIGEGFESNASFSHYTIRHPKGIFPIEESNDSTEDSTKIHPNQTVG
ncbi:MAG: LPS export ABC transporter periplasmic protein LptC [Paludibacteraceae bacterium]|nr:LPS export ABC transporter periplasmic protein LptC [Paludibacteraceae bacterium]